MQNVYNCLPTVVSLFTVHHPNWWIKKKNHFQCIGPEFWPWTSVSSWLHLSYPEWGSRLRLKFNNTVIIKIYSLSFSIFKVLYRPLLVPSSSGFSNGNGTEPRWRSPAKTEVFSIKKIYGWSCCVFRVWPNRHKELLLVADSFWPQSLKPNVIHHCSMAFVAMHNRSVSTFTTFPSVSPSPLCPSFCSINTLNWRPSEL